MCPFTDSSQLQQQQTSRSPSTTPTYRQFLTSSVRPRSTRARWQGLPKVARNLTRSFFEIGHKRCNSNDRISMSEICAQELRATFLGNHSSEATERHDNTARHYANEQRAATHQHGGHCTRYGALHPLWGATPVMGRCTRSERVHCLEIGCSAPNHKNKRGIRETTADTPAASSSCCKPPLPNSRPLHRGRILTVPMESAPAGQVAVAGAVERPESDDGNHPSKSRT